MSNCIFNFCDLLTCYMSTQECGVQICTHCAHRSPCHTKGERMFYKYCAEILNRQEYPREYAEILNKGKSDLSSWKCTNKVFLKFATPTGDIHDFMLWWALLKVITCTLCMRHLYIHGSLDNPSSWTNVYNSETSRGCGTLGNK